MTEIMSNVPESNEEFIKVTGWVRAYFNGELISEKANTVTTVGKQQLATLLNSANAGTTWVTNMGFGSGTTAAAITDTALVTELTASGYARPGVTRSVTGAQIQYQATLTNVSTQVTVNEVGLFDALTVGHLEARQVLASGVTLSSSSDSLQITWQINLS